MKTTPKKEAKDLSSKLTKINLVELGIEQVYLFTCTVNIFVLYVGQLIPATGWNDRLKSTIEERLNENCNADGKISFIDHTYKKSKDENGEYKNNNGSSRRLRSLGGGIRRIVYLIKKYSEYDNKDDSQGDSQGNKASLTSKEIFHSLKSYLIKISNQTLGEKEVDEKELWAQLYGVQYNKKLVPTSKQKTDISVTFPTEMLQKCQFFWRRKASIFTIFSIYLLK